MNFSLAHPFRIIRTGPAAMLLCLVAAVICVGISSQQVRAADRANALLTEAQANRYGMSVRWTGRSASNPLHARIVDMIQYVGPRKKEFSFEVKVGDKTDIFSQRDRDRYGKILGIEGARKKAEKYAEGMRDLGLETTVEEKSKSLQPMIYALMLSSSSRVDCLSGETGEVIWTRHVGERDAPAWMQAANGYLVVVNGTSVHCLDVETGKTFWVRPTLSAPSGRPGLTDDCVFVPMVSGILQDFSLFDETEVPKKINSPGLMRTGLLATPNKVAWVTSRNHLNVAFGKVSNNYRTIDYRLQLDSEVASPPASLEYMKDGERSFKILTANSYGVVHCLKEGSGAIQWVFPTAQSIRLSPLAFGNDVYVTTTKRSLFSINGETGIENWRTNNVREVFAASEKNLYGFDGAHRMVVIEREHGTITKVLPFEAPDFYLTNLYTDRIMVGTVGGAVQCLQEIGHDEPTFHRMILDEQVKRKQKKKKKKKEKSESSKTENPFGFGGDTDDPFGGGSSGDDPFGSGGSGGDDPFGTKSDDSGGADGTKNDDPFSSDDDPFG